MPSQAKGAFYFTSPPYHSKNTHGMNILIALTAILAATAIILWTIRHTRQLPQHKPYIAPKPENQPLTREEVQAYADEEELRCKPGFLHYAFTRTFAVEDNELGLFIGHATADPQHNGSILIADENGIPRGQIASQPQLYEQLIANRRTTCYGVSRKQEDTYRGEVCIRNN